MSYFSNPVDGAYVNLILNLLASGNTITVPTEFHEQYQAIKQLLNSDSSGLITTLIDFMISSANVEYQIETENDNLNKKYEKWLLNINRSYNGQVPKGIKALAEEYFKERWAGASFPILKIVDWEEIDGISFPTKLFFVNGGAVYADKKEGDAIRLIDYDYRIGKAKNKNLILSPDNCIITKPFGRIYEKYPIPFIVKRGVYKNAKLMDVLKGKQGELLSQIIPLVNLIKRGSERMAIEGKHEQDEDLKKIKEQIQTMLTELKTTSAKQKSPVRVVPFDENWEHIVPDIEKLFSPAVITSLEKSILGGLGFIDVASAFSNNRKESILSPKPMISEVNKAIADFAKIIENLIDRIWEKNKKSKLYSTRQSYVTYTPVKLFMSDAFKQEMRLLWKNGGLSTQSYVEIVGETPFKVESFRRTKEAKSKLDLLHYPHWTRNKEDVQAPEQFEVPEEEDKNGNKIPQDKIDKTQSKDKYDLSKKKLEIAPYQTIKKLPKSIRNNMGVELQKIWMNVFNRAYNTYADDETRAFKTAWSVIKKIAYKNKKGYWVRKAGSKLSSAELEKIIKKEEI